MKTVFKLEQSGDCEGRSRTTVGIFSKKSDAEVVGKTGFKNSGMGGSQDARVSEITLYESIEDFSATNPQYNGEGLSRDQRTARLRKSGLEKLSADERAALGVS